ncbi:hypothetical protein M758_UG066800 [Ceratodon purpureus]|nr:hypothetical protein M758_UG066800 [Ceratodon purpureus]
MNTPSRTLNPNMMSNLEYTMSGGLQGYRPNQSCPRSSQLYGQTTSHTTGSFGRGVSSGGSGGTGHTAATEGSATRAQQHSASMSQQHIDAPYFTHPGAPNWTGSSVLSPFPFPMNSAEQGSPIPYPPRDKLICPPLPPDLSKHAKDLVQHEVSK